MILSKGPTTILCSDVVLKGQELKVLHKFKYLGDSTLSFENHVKNISFDLHNIKQIRSSLPKNATKLFLFSILI